MSRLSEFRSAERELSIVLNHLIFAKGDPQLAFAVAEGKVSPRVEALMKGISTGGSLGDAAWMANMSGAPVIAAFMESLSAYSVAFNFFNTDATVRVPMHQSMVLMTQAFSAQVVGEGEAVPVSKAQITAPNMVARKVAGMFAISDTVVRGIGPVQQALLDSALRNAISLALDTAFFIDFIDSATPQLNATSDPIDDINALLAAVVFAKGSQPYFVVGTTAAKAATTARLTNGSLAFVDMSPSGGSMVNIPAQVSSGIDPDAIWLLDAQGIALDIGTVAIDVSREATVQLNTTPTADSIAGTAVQATSLYQSNLVACKATAPFAAQRLRDDAMAILNNVAWQSAST